MASTQEPNRKRSLSPSRATADSSFARVPSVASKLRPSIVMPEGRGVAVATTLFACWAAVFYYAHTQICLWGPNMSSPMETLTAFLMLEFLYTGLFITTHDAFHGGVAPKNKALNDFIGAVAIYIFAAFDYKAMHGKHMDHHEYTGRVGRDPDFHHGDTNLLSWFGSFMWDYTTWQQVVRINLEASVLVFLFHVPFANIVLFKWTAPMVSAFRLFYFGTYLPHRPKDAEEVMSWEKTRSTQDSRLASMLKCYHFDCHWEHHKWPHAPWWQLYDYRQFTENLLKQSAVKDLTALLQEDNSDASSGVGTRQARTQQTNAISPARRLPALGKPARPSYVGRHVSMRRFAGRIPTTRQVNLRVA